MADEEPKNQQNPNLFGFESDDALSDLEDEDQVAHSSTGQYDDYHRPSAAPSDAGDEEQAKPNEGEEGETFEPAQEEAYNDDDDETPTYLDQKKLPSFKRRDRQLSEAEQQELERVRKEIREKKSRQRGDDDSQNETQEPAEPPSEQQAALDEISQIFEDALKGPKKKRKRADEEDLENSLDEELMNLREKMIKVADDDKEANMERKPAVGKLNMLQEVTILLTNKRAQDSILDNQLLSAIRMWLEPLPDNSLPSIDIQNELFDVLNTLPIGSDHLRESGVGKIVYFYQRSPRTNPRVKRKAEQLIAKWSRMVIKRSANYRERRHERKVYTQEDMLANRKKYRPNEPEERSQGTEGRRMQMHVNVPRAVAPDYDIIPESTVQAVRRNKGPAGTMKRLKDTMRSMKSSGVKRTAK
ncbi:hypothetical protein BCR43DRAFT_456212 [Syncephalastrum racemosum]|uniref:TFIIS N-terminal domain-containing protein n=1 Tax=Syncephalastrum racemosum TaxID=13706 RepID=A0A1X2HEB8_SYNRA|nr:hypothetical protein BCR43DRAFT_456212 [Syncephalastrum racemosum]